MPANLPRRILPRLKVFHAFLVHVVELLRWYAKEVGGSQHLQFSITAEQS